MVRTQSNKSIKIMHSDSGGEHISKEFIEYLANEGTIHQQTCSHQSQQKGVRERKHRHIQETARAIRLHANLPKAFWTKGVSTAVYLINQLLTPMLGNISPLEKLFGYAPKYNLLRIFGCTCYVLHRYEHSKIDANSAKCIFLGYSETQKGYRRYDWVAKKMRLSRNIIFLSTIYTLLILEILILSHHLIL